MCHIALEGVGFPLPRKGVGRCPNGGLYGFEIETNENEVEVKKDKFGNTMKDEKFKLTPIAEEKHDRFYKKNKKGREIRTAPEAGNPYHKETNGGIDRY